MSSQLVEIDWETISQVFIMDGTRREWRDETDNPEDDREDDGAYGKDDPACQSHHQAGAHPVACLRFLLLIFIRLGPHHIHPFYETKISSHRSLEHLICGV